MSIDQHRGAPPLPPLVAYAVLTVAALVVPAVLADGSPWASDTAFAVALTDHPAAIRWQSLLTLAAAIPLAVLSAIVADRIRTLGLHIPGRLIALVGGCGAAIMLAISGLVPVALLAAPGDRSLAAVGRDLATTAGGTAFSMFLGLLVAGIAVTGLLGRLLGRRVAIAGLVVAVVGELCVLTVLTDVADPLLPVMRFGSIVWLLVAVPTLGGR